MTISATQPGTAAAGISHNPVPQTVVQSWICPTCLASLRIEDRPWTFCDQCSQYMHRLPRAGTSTQSKCVRTGWTKGGGGSAKISQMNLCVECRFKDDPEWHCWLRSQQLQQDDSAMVTDTSSAHSEACVLAHAPAEGTTQEQRLP
jgi:hypothetical protein